MSSGRMFAPIKFYSFTTLNLNFNGSFKNLKETKLNLLTRFYENVSWNKLKLS